MARTISDEELQLKRRARRRLIGAIVLVTAIIVALPMVLDSEPRPVGRDIAVQIPSPESGRFAAKLTQLPAPKARDAKEAPEPPGSRPAEKAREPKNSTAEAATTPPAAPAPKPEAPTVKKPKAAPARPAAGAGKPVEGRYVVQVIALADAGKARNMQERIAATGIKAYTEIVKTSKGDVTRVRAGPFATRAAAEKAREQLKSLGMNGNVTAK